MANLLDQIAAFFRQAKPTSAGTTTLDDSRPVRQSYDSLAQILRADTERRRIVETCRRMYATDPRIKGILHSIGRDAVKGGFSISVSNDARAEQVANDMVTRLKLVKTMDDYVRLTLRDGDSLIEVGVNADREIAKLSRKPTLQMHRHSNSFDEFDDPQFAYWFHDRQVYGEQVPADAIWFAEWQIIHVRWSHDEGERYGCPLFSASTGAWKRVEQAEIDMAIRRNTRAGMKYLHVVEGATEAELDAYRERNKYTLSSPFAAVADYYTSKAGSLQTVQGDANLGDIRDVSHHIATMWLSSPLPMALLGYGESLNRDVLEEQTEQYHAALESITEWVTDSIVVPLLERQWLLAGILPESLDYAIEWATKQTLSAPSLEQVARAIGALVGTGKFTDETIYRTVGRFLPGFDWRAEMAAAEEREEQSQADQMALDMIAAAMTRGAKDQEPETEEPEVEG